MTRARVPGRLLLISLSPESTPNDRLSTHLRNLVPYLLPMNELGEAAFAGIDWVKACDNFTTEDSSRC